MILRENEIKGTCKLVLYIEGSHKCIHTKEQDHEIYARNNTKALLKSENNQYTASRIQKEIRKMKRAMVRMKLYI